MRIVDLSQPLKTGMTVYPGDPPVRIDQIHDLHEHGWRLRLLSMGTHTGTHVDAPAHMHAQGKTLDQLALERFCGKAYVADVAAPSYREGLGLIFRTGEVGLPMLDRIARSAPFIVVGDAATLATDMEKALLAKEILTFTDAINLSQLPTDQDVLFFGMPLAIAEGDGSPVRAIAIVD